MATLIVGGGIVGVTAAHYLLKKGKKVTLIEKCAIACHSSGKAGGFLTDGDSGWHSGPIARLAKRSFALHEDLAKELGSETIGHRRVKCVGQGRDASTAQPAWLAPGQYQRDMGNESGLAQVTPYKLMEALKDSIVKQGCEIIIGKAVGVEMEGASVKALKVQQDGKETSLPCAALIMGMGAWANEAAKWFPESTLPQRTVSNRYTSVIWDDVEVGKDATMVFTMGEDHTEIYPRTNECYANGCPTDPPLPDNPMEIEPPQDEIDKVKAESIAAVPRLKDATIIRTTACFLAGSDDHRPVVGRVPKTENAIIACGGGCWGILNGPAMGEAAAAMAAGEELPLDMAPFDPIRFDRSHLPAFIKGLPPKLTVAWCIFRLA
ncbi:yurR [Symbiodinium pilosum]|uniref:YurR protein n=1 Tax=Symbiodinium pilosum TaxID=2952 RepID=A0A812TUL4_SYMPI|nr:yurR [Symbiodinium pilosum]